MCSETEYYTDAVEKLWKEFKTFFVPQKLAFLVVLESVVSCSIIEKETI